ncbi:MAG: hypothetical protein MI923_05805, partial [Phycisphaerales bacterium]|nr:hypothetical protein [Phycisphaerales bacterium]
AGSGQRAAGSGQRAAGSGQRAAGSVRMISADPHPGEMLWCGGQKMVFDVEHHLAVSPTKALSKKEYLKPADLQANLLLFFYLFAF